MPQNDTHCTCGPKFAGWIAEDPDKRGKSVGGLETNNGWWICSRCGFPSLQALNECDVCERKWKGPRPGIKFAITCPDCESKFAKN